MDFQQEVKGGSFREIVSRLQAVLRSKQLDSRVGSTDLEMKGRRRQRTGARDKGRPPTLNPLGLKLSFKDYPRGPLCKKKLTVQ